MLFQQIRALITEINIMITLIKSIKTLLLWLYFLLIFTLALLPILTSAEITSSFVYLALAYLALAIISFNIENKLNKYLSGIDKDEVKVKEKKCLIYRGICCLHS